MDSYSSDSSHSTFAGTGNSFISGTSASLENFVNSGVNEFNTSSDLKQMLESNRDDVKLEAMKCITTMTAKGKMTLPRSLFPHIVKNVSSKNAELRKLVYLYLTSFGDQEPDMALLSIASIQKSLRNPNPLVRSSALRVLTSMRLNILSVILVATIKNAVNDLSPYVKKTVAHAIVKIYRLDPNLKDELVEYIQRLLNDKNSMVISSAVVAFEVVCPEKLEMIHKHYRKFCSLLADCSEWGQVILLNLLMRYARGQFLDPNCSPDATGSDDILPLDQDHRLLLRSAKPLLQSHNSAVVLAVVQLYLTTAPHNEIRSTIVRPLIRLLHSHREIQLIILSLLEDLTSKHPDLDHEKENKSQSNADTELQDLTKDEQPSEVVVSPIFEKENDTDATNGSDLLKSAEDNDDDGGTSDDEKAAKFSYNDMFQPYLKSFFIKPTDCTLVRILKLRILTNLSSSANISLVLRELQAYIVNYVDDEDFISATVQAIGTCASTIKEVAPVCLNGLTSLLSNKNEIIVSEAIVVLRSQIINKDDNDTTASTIIKQVTKLLPSITTPQARATIVWILGEYCNKNLRAAKCAPNVLRQVAKSFCNEDSIVKLQALNLAAKLLLSIDKEEKKDLHEKITLLSNYIFSLAKYDLNYDVRDRGRFLKQLISDEQLSKEILVSQCQLKKQNSVFSGTSKTRIFFANGQTAASKSNRVNDLTPGTLSHFVDHMLPGYQPLPDYPSEQPDTTVRLTTIAQPQLGSSLITNEENKSGNGSQVSGGNSKMVDNHQIEISSESEEDDDDESEYEYEEVDEEEEVEVTDEEGNQEIK